MSSEQEQQHDADATVQPIHPLTAALSAAREVGKFVEITDITLVDSVITQNLINGQLPTQLKFSVESKTSEDGNRIDVVSSYRLVARYEDKVADHEPLKIEAKFKVAYVISQRDGFSEEQIKNFGNLNGAYSSWSYWREYVQTTLARMGLPRLTVPIFTPHSLAKFVLGIHKEEQPAAISAATEEAKA